MFDLGQNKHCNFESACRHFVVNNNVSVLADKVRISAQVLRNKLNPDQPHRLTVDELILLTQTSGDSTLIDGVLLQLNKLPSVPNQTQTNSDPIHLPTYAMSATAATGAICGETATIMTGERLTLAKKRAIIDKANAAIRDLSMVVIAIEQRFNATPVITTALDIFGSMGAAIN